MWQYDWQSTGPWDSKASTRRKTRENPKWGYTPVMLALGVLGQKDHESLSSLNYMGKLPKNNSIECKGHSWWLMIIKRTEVSEEKIKRAMNDEPKGNLNLQFEWFSTLSHCSSWWVGPEHRGAVWAEACTQNPWDFLPTQWRSSACSSKPNSHLQRKPRPPLSVLWLRTQTCSQPPLLLPHGLLAGGSTHITTLEVTQDTNNHLGAPRWL